MQNVDWSLGYVWMDYWTRTIGLCKIWKKFRLLRGGNLSCIYGISFLQFGKIFCIVRFFIITQTHKLWTNNWLTTEKVYCSTIGIRKNLISNFSLWIFQLFLNVTSDNYNPPLFHTFKTEILPIYLSFHHKNYEKDN